MPFFVGNEENLHGMKSGQPKQLFCVLIFRRQNIEDVAQYTSVMCLRNNSDCEA